jgi:Family of unknown function (DUF5677)
MKEIAKELKTIYKKFEPWLETRRVGKLRNGRIFDCCVRSAISKLFDFNTSIITLALQAKPIPAFFVAGSLRGSCEDLIVLGFLQNVPNAQRDEILSNWLFHEIQTNVITQTSFFRKNRPFQNVLASEDQAVLQKYVAAVHPLWKALGFSLKPDSIAPSTWAMAKQAGISEVYEFFYRFSCDIVHFNPAVLLRFGWGDEPSKPRFDASNFDLYYQSFGLVYGAYVWCLFLQLLRRNVRTSKGARSAEKELVKWLRMHERWPEMVTREEMNLPPAKANILTLLTRIALAQDHKPLIRRRRK